MLAGDGERQFNPNSFGLNSLAGPDILSFSGTSSGGTNAGVGVLTASVVNNVGNISITADTNDGGTLKLGQVLNGTYTVASNGRTALTGLGSTNQIAYLIQQDRAFFIGEDPSDPPFGQIEPQVGAPFPASPFLNNLFLGEDELAPNGKEDLTGVAVLAPSNVLNVTADNSHSGGDLTFGQSISLSYTVDSTGHFTAPQSSATGGLTGYVVSRFKIDILWHKRANLRPIAFGPSKPDHRPIHSAAAGCAFAGNDLGELCGAGGGGKHCAIRSCSIQQYGSGAAYAADAHKCGGFQRCGNVRDFAAGGAGAGADVPGGRHVRAGSDHAVEHATQRNDYDRDRRRKHHDHRYRHGRRRNCCGRAELACFWSAGG